jgi:ATP citrate (pro-S)-lyase
VIKALREFAPTLIEHNIHIWVRRAGPNYQEGLKNIKAVGQELKLDMHVYGPDCKHNFECLPRVMKLTCSGHVSGIVPMALLGKNPSGIKEYSG